MKKISAVAILIFLSSVFAFAQDVEDGLNDPIPLDPSFQPEESLPEDSPELKVFDTKAFQKMLQGEFEARANVFPVFLDFLKRKTPTPVDSSDPLENLKASNLDIEVYKRPKTFPEFMVLRADDKVIMVAIVSTAKAGKATPSGRYRSFHYRNKYQRSSIYHNAPMPYANFFSGNRAFHGTVEENYKLLGGPASSGCVRLQVSDAKKLWDYVNRFGREAFETIIHESGDESFRDLKDYTQIAASVEASLQQRDTALAIFQKSKIRSPDWPGGYWK